jgi:hypothetical protein
MDKEAIRCLFLTSSFDCTDTAENLKPSFYLDLEYIQCISFYFIFFISLLWLHVV